MSTPSFEQQVLDTVKEVKRGEDGKLQLPADLSDEMRFAVTAEIRRRDTQSEYTKAQQKKVELEAKLSEYEKELSKNVQIMVSDEEKAELEALRYDDPNAWRHRVNELEREAVEKAQKDLQEKVAKSSFEVEIERRKTVLKDFQESTGIMVNDDVLANDIPPRITQKLANNEVSFEDFLLEVGEYLTSGKAIHTGDKAPNLPNLGKTGGGTMPEDDSIYNSMNYEQEIY